MISYEKGFSFSIAIGSHKDFIPEADFDSAMIIEEAGNLLPTCEVVFRLRDMSVLKSINQGNTMLVGIGNYGKLYYGSFMITRRYIIAEAFDHVDLKLIGILDTVPYLSDTAVKYFKQKKSSECIQAIVSQYFSYKTNFTESPNDTMNWFQSNITDRAMVNKLWLHAKYPDNDVPMVGITAKQEFLHKGIDKTLKEPPWILTFDRTKKGSKIIYYDMKSSVLYNNGVVDAGSGYAKGRIVHNVDVNDTNYNTPQLPVMLASTSKSDSINPGSRASTISIQNSNMHENWYDTKDFNVRALSKLNSIQAKVGVILEPLNDLSILDHVIFEDLPQEKVSNPAREETSGHWFVSKVCRKIHNRRYVNIITLTRDSINSVAS